MGCDIHMWAEIREDNKWKMDDAMLYDNPDFKEGSTNEWQKRYTKKIYDDRDYELFAFLADVRNSYGIKPLNTPKGIPSDSSFGYLHHVESWDGDGHSHSYFSLKELIEIPKEVIEQEFDDGRLIMAKNEDGTIKETCAWSTRESLGKVGKRKLFSLWKQEPIKQIIKNLESLKEEHDIENNEHVRIVFFFDN